jgi:hypothetical protein
MLLLPPAMFVVLTPRPRCSELIFLISCRFSRRGVCRANPSPPAGPVMKHRSIAVPLRWPKPGSSEQAVGACDAVRWEYVMQEGREGGREAVGACEQAVGACCPPNLTFCFLLLLTAVVCVCRVTPYFQRAPVKTSWCPLRWQATVWEACCPRTTKMACPPPNGFLATSVEEFTDAIVQVCEVVRLLTL